MIRVDLAKSHCAVNPVRSEQDGHTPSSCRRHLALIFSMPASPQSLLSLRSTLLRPRAQVLCPSGLGQGSEIQEPLMDSIMGLCLVRLITFYGENIVKRR